MSKNSHFICTILSKSNDDTILPWNAVSHKVKIKITDPRDVNSNYSSLYYKKLCLCSRVVCPIQKSTFLFFNLWLIKEDGRIHISQQKFLLLFVCKLSCLLETLIFTFQKIQKQIFSTEFLKTALDMKY